MTSTSPSNSTFASSMRYPGGNMPQTFNDLLGGNTARHGRTAATHSPKQGGGRAQFLGWQSPTVYQYSGKLQGPAREMELLASSVADDLPAELDSAAKIVALKAQLHQLETAKTPSPRKRNSPDVFDGEASPPNRPQQGPIEGMWGAGVSHEQRAMIAQASSPVANTPSPAKKRKTTKKEPKPAARKEATPKKTPAKKAVKKTNKRSMSSSSISAFTTINGEITLSSEALAQPIRPVDELLDLPWEELTHIEKATLLLPMLQGFQPETGEQLDAPGSLLPQASYEQGNYNNDAEQVSQSINQDFANYVAPEERRYIEDVADPAYFTHAHDLNNVDGAEEQSTYTQDPVGQVLFNDYEYSDDVKSTEPAIKQDAAFSQSVAESFNVNTPEQDEPMHLPSGWYFSETQTDDFVASDAPAASEQDTHNHLPSDCTFGTPQADHYLSTAEPVSEYTDLTSTSMNISENIDAQMLSSFNNGNQASVDTSIMLSEDDMNALVLATFGNNNEKQTSDDFFANFMGAEQTIADPFLDLPAVNQTGTDMFYQFISGANSNSNDIVSTSSDHSFMDDLNLDGMNANGNGNGVDFTASDNFTDFTSVGSLLDMSQYTTEPDFVKTDTDFQAGMVRQRAALEKYERTGGRRR